MHKARRCHHRICPLHRHRHHHHHLPPPLPPPPPLTQFPLPLQALNATFFPPTEAPIAPSAPDVADGDTDVVALLKALADENEGTLKYSAAEQYHLERVASAEHDPQVWMDYGCFLMRTNNAPKAEECSREAVALNAGDFRRGPAPRPRPRLPRQPRGRRAFPQICSRDEDLVDLVVAPRRHPLRIDGTRYASGRVSTGRLTRAAPHRSRRSSSLSRPRRSDREEARLRPRAVRWRRAPSLRGCYLALAQELLPMSAKPFVLKALEMEAAEAPRARRSPPPPPSSPPNSRSTTMTSTARRRNSRRRWRPRRRNWRGGACSERPSCAAAMRRRRARRTARRCRSRRPRWRRARCSAPRASPSLPESR